MDNKDLITLEGDFNARTGNLTDYIINENNEDKFLPLPDFYENKSIRKGRINQDTKVNEFGYELRDLCISANLKILNGRTIGDLSGQYTYTGPRDCSTVDYVLASNNILSGNDEIVKKFQIENISSLSDHRSTSVYLQKRNGSVKIEPLETILDNCKTREKKRIYNPKYEKIINSNNVKKTARNILNHINTNDDIETIDILQKEVEDIIINVAGKCQSIGIDKQKLINNKRKKAKKE